jgi:beta-lactamase superfamily II metal-dependent hydrolase
MKQPSDVTVRLYNVGFGDCILLTFDYPESRTRPQRHMLIDCGSTKAANGVALLDVVNDIQARVDQLDVLVVTHRHADHLSAFGAQATGSILEKLQPKVVLRPWVDDPTTAGNADEPHLAFVRSLQLAQNFANQLEAAIMTARAESRGRTPDLLAAAAGQGSNAAAKTRIDRISSAGDAHYVSASLRPLKLRQLPGVTLNILGPPTYKQLPTDRREATNYKDQYWLRQVSFLQDALSIAGLTSKQAKIAARAALDADDADDIIGPQRWLIARMQERHEQSLSRIVEGIDKALNNTSIILLVQAGTRKLLLPGDAQGENWSWALEYAPEPQRRAWKKLLSNIDLYKVGHHGSRNATPKALYELWVNQQRSLVSVMSTLPGKFPGTPGSGTEVPRKTLIAALHKVGQLERTDSLRKRVSLAVTASTHTRQPFAAIAPRDDVISETQPA